MAAKRSPSQLAPIAQFLEELYELGDYATWKEFAEDAGISAPQVSDFKNGQVEPAGLNLLKLIRAAAARSRTSAAQIATRSVPLEAPLREEIGGAVEKILQGQQTAAKEIGDRQREVLAAIEMLRSHLDDLPSAGRSFPRRRQGNQSR